ncbi:DUF669 domain-containing protein [Bacillus thuringiensis]|uniref:DUF669 domain-containing protein n=1 Tax=Bacillus thuringiensis TaxID=1428 RepID=A0A9W3VHM9_BACTU|nr:DUF669 domain-containing protein [Bacillus thuringiensis]AMR06487.1 porphobilinogen deaminase [Bacillus thuringiensis]AYF85199.1 DUF669 domain-containing protein [Bacillus thuringiensis]PNK35037.1 porphobilinogen deaminase [Bacillus thuringiensis]
MSFKFKFDEENVSQGFGLVEEGKYEVTMIAAEAKEWQGQYSIGFDVEIRSDIEQKHQGAKILYNTLYLTSSNPDYKEDTEKKRNSFLKACGYTGKQELDLNAVVHEILGKTVLAYVKHETKNDKTFAKVKFVAPSNVTPPQPSGPPINLGDDDLPF